MKICIPIIKDKGMESRVNPHFGSAPLFMMVETDSGELRPLPNQNVGHAHGQCRPLASLAGHEIDGVVVGGIGQGALNKLQAAGVEVFISDRRTVAEVLAQLEDGSLSRMTGEMACGHGQGAGRGQRRGAGCGHGHGQGRGQGQGHRHGHGRGGCSGGSKPN